MELRSCDGLEQLTVAAAASVLPMGGQNTQNPKTEIEKPEPEPEKPEPEKPEP